MTYDPLRPTVRDEIRFLATDTDPAAEVLSDAEYDVSIAKEPNWKRAAAELIEAVADRIDQQRTSFGRAGGVTLGWSSSRTNGLRVKAARLRAEADAEDAAASDGRSVLLEVPYLSGGEDGW